MGKTYAFKYSAKNSIGESLHSDELYVALARKQSKPQPVTFDQSQSNRFKNVVQWNEAAALDILVTGYRLYTDDGLPGNLFLIYDGLGDT